MIMPSKASMVLCIAAFNFFHCGIKSFLVLCVMGLETQDSVHKNDTSCLRLYLDDKQLEAGNLTLFYGYMTVILAYHRFLSLWSLNLSELV